MFTGIVELIGTVHEFIASAGSDAGATMTVIDCSKIMTDCHIGDSIAINGCCLTVTEFDDDSFKVGLVPETLRRTNLGSLKAGDKVNLERAIGGDVRFGGHYVQGHIDTVAEILEIVPEGSALNFKFKLRDFKYINYIVEKGFISLDGTSLTITFVNHDEGAFGISMIKHTQENVVLPLKKIGQLVNIEVDLTGKVIERQVELLLNSQIQSKNSPLVSMVTSIIEKKIKELKV